MFRSKKVAQLQQEGRPPAAGLFNRVLIVLPLFTAARQRLCERPYRPVRGRPALLLPDSASDSAFVTSTFAGESASNRYREYPTDSHWDMLSCKNKGGDGEVAGFAAADNSQPLS